MNILLVYPQYPDTFWSFKSVLKFISKKAAFPPLGLLTVAAMLPKEWNLKLVDINVRPLNDEAILWADMVFISAMIAQKKGAQEAIDQCKAKGKLIIAGGPAFTSQREEFTGVDHFILNEAEVTLPMFLKDLERGKLQTVYSSTEKPNIANTPIPLWSLINLKDYVAVSIQYSRGCPFNCEFCDIIVMNGRIQRTKTTNQFLNELQALYDAGWRKGTVFIADDNLIGNKTRIKETLPAVIEWQKKHKYPFPLMTQASINLAEDEDLMNLMSAANFFKVFIGIETPNEESLKECGKFQNTKSSLTEAVQAIHKHGMQVMGGFIVGFDNDDESIFERQIKFIQEAGIVTAMVGLLNAFPQTRLWHRLAAEGRLEHNTSGENTDGSMNFTPIMGKEKLIAGYKKILTNLCLPKNYYKRIDEFIKAYKPTVKTHINMSDIKALLRSTWRIGIFSRSNFRYWWLITKTGFTKIKALPMAIELAIFGLHFSKTAKKVANNHSGSN